MIGTLYQITIPKTVNELRKSSYHQELAHKLFASFVAQQQGITLQTALKKVSGPIGDYWLVLAELARYGGLEDSPVEVNQSQQQMPTSLM